MTPHSVIESMVGAVKDHGVHEWMRKHVDLSVWPDVLRSLRTSVHFELGEARPTGEHEEFGFDMFERDLFQFPFPVTFWTGRASPHTAVLVSVDDPMPWRPTGAHAGGARGIGAIIIGEMVDKASGRQWAVPLLSGRMSYTPLAPDGNVRFGWRGLTQHAISRTTGEAWMPDQFMAGIDKAFRLVVGSTVMLMTDDVQQRIEQAPAKLNLAREKRGKPPIGERRIIMIRQHAREALSGEIARAAFDERRGPRPHMRRGHFRTIYRDTERERVIPVAPSVIGLTGEARESIKAKSYKVTT